MLLSLFLPAAGDRLRPRRRTRPFHPALPSGGTRPLAAVVLALLAWGALAAGSRAQEEGSPIPPEYRGADEHVVRGVLDGNLIWTNFRNHGELSRAEDFPNGFWPRGSGGRQVDIIGLFTAAQVPGERAKWAHLVPSWAGKGDTLLNPVIVNYAIGRKVVRDTTWGWLPLPGFHNPFRIDPVTGTFAPTPAISGDPSSWPAFWPDKLREEDAGWRNDAVDGNPNVAAWNGFFGKGVQNADLEAYYVMDDHSDYEYRIDPLTGRPQSAYGVFYPNPADSTMGGLGVQTQVRLFQWSNVLAEDILFMLYRFTNVGQFDYERFYVMQAMHAGMPPEGNEAGAFDPQLDVTFTWDTSGLCQDQGRTYDCAYVGMAFLESPSRPSDGLDNDEDGITDETRSTGPGLLVEGQEAIRSYVASTYDVGRFTGFINRQRGTNLTFDELLAERPAYQAGRWWTGDENLDWVGFDDENGNGRCDAGELLNDDYGRDGLGPYDVTYPGPDAGECDGMPTEGEPNYDRTDVDESDQVGLTGFGMEPRPFWNDASHFENDDWLWNELVNVVQFPLGTQPREEEATGLEPVLVFSSGPVSLRSQQSDFFSIGMLFGQDREDLLRNRRRAQSIYNADYRFAQPPIMPTLKAEAGDGYVILSWDTVAAVSFDRFLQEFDFEGYRLYKGTDPLLSDAKVVTSFDGTPTFYKPLAQWDLRNGIRGKRWVLDGEAVYDLGQDTGLNFAYVDRDVTNGKTYYYALVAYDRGYEPEEGGPTSEPVDPQENTFFISVDQGGEVRGMSRNAAVVTPRARAAGYQSASANEDLSAPHGTVSPVRQEPLGSGSIEVTIVDPQDVPEQAVYRLVFHDTLRSRTVYETSGYTLVDLATQDTLLANARFEESSPVVGGIAIDFFNDERGLDPARTGWVGTGNDGQPLISPNPARLRDMETNWSAFVQPDQTQNFQDQGYNFELVWVHPADSTYRTERTSQGYIQANIPVFCRNLGTGLPCGILLYDADGSGGFTAADELVIAERATRFSAYGHYYRVSFQLPEGAESRPPAPGSRLRVTQSLPFAEGDYFQFTLRSGYIDDAAARSELDDVAVVPNPYLATASWEPETNITGRGPRRVQFINLPASCTVRIYTVRGELVRTLYHDDPSGGGALWWDLKTEGNQEIAYGVYIYHVESPWGETTGKLAIVK